MYSWSQRDAPPWIWIASQGDGAVEQSFNIPGSQSFTVVSRCRGGQCERAKIAIIEIAARVGLWLIINLYNCLNYTWNCCIRKEYTWEYLECRVSDPKLILYHILYIHIHNIIISRYVWSSLLYRLSAIRSILQFDVSAWNIVPVCRQVVIEGLRGRDTILSLKKKLIEDWKKKADWSQFWQLNVVELCDSWCDFYYILIIY